MAPSNAQNALCPKIVHKRRVPSSVTFQEASIKASLAPRSGEAQGLCTYHCGGVAGVVGVVGVVGVAV
jgi:hypothetical protein